MKDADKIDVKHEVWQAEPSEIQSNVEACHKVFDSNEHSNNKFVLWISKEKDLIFFVAQIEK